MNAPSRFIKEIPVELLEGMEPVNQKVGWHRGLQVLLYKAKIKPFNFYEDQA